MRQARLGIAAFDFEHLRELELRQARMREVEGDGDAGHAVGREPLVGQPVVRPEREAARVELGVDLRDALLELGARDRRAPRSHIRTSSSFSSGQRRPLGIRHQRIRIGGVLFPPFGVALVGVGDAQQRRLVEQPAGQLQADRQAIGGEAARHADRRQAGQVRADGEDVGQIHLQRIVDLLAEPERRRRARRHGDDVDRSNACS